MNYDKTESVHAEKAFHHKWTQKLSNAFDLFLDVGF